jgi:hypothetical protein
MARPRTSRFWASQPATITTAVRPAESTSLTGVLPGQREYDRQCGMVGVPRDEVDPDQAESPIHEALAGDAGPSIESHRNSARLGAAVDSQPVLFVQGAFAHLAYYQDRLPTATARPIDGSEHSFVEGLPTLVDDIKSLPR